jgi:hypothetical protein
MKTALTIWVIAVFYCIIEAIFFAKLDSESKKFLKEKENEEKNNSLYK